MMLSATAVIWTLVFVVWLSVLGPTRAYEVLRDHYSAPLAMVLGAFVAGCVGVPRRCQRVCTHATILSLNPCMLHAGRRPSVEALWVCHW